MYRTIIIFHIMLFLVLAFKISTGLAADDLLTAPTLDASRNQPQEDWSSKQPLVRKPNVVTNVPIINQVPPKEARNFKFILKNVQINNATIFNPKIFEKFYSTFINKQITLEQIYEIVNQITALYKESGYFLSIAELPPQKISITKGSVRINVIEGYIKQIAFPQGLEKYHPIIANYVNPLLQQQPINIRALESALLQLNDLYGYNFNGVITINKEFPPGAIILSLNATKIKPKNFISLDNYASRLTGPEAISLHYNIFGSPLCTSSIKANANPAKIKDINYISLQHNHKLNKTISLDLGFNTNKIATTSILNTTTRSKTNSFSTGFNAMLWKQRQQDLNVNVTINLRRAKNYISGNPIKQDNITTLKFGSIHNYNDKFNGLHNTNIIFTKGLSIFGASNKQSAEKSRSLAVPNFNKLELNYSYWRLISPTFSLCIYFSGQYAFNPLYSAEEFGYGGPNVGRAFDNSELSGDHGVSSSIEISYTCPQKFNNLMIKPYIFYDMGKVWRKDPTRNATAAAASLGLGFRANLYKSIHTNLGVAWPIVRKLSNPIDLKTSHKPRINAKIACEW